MLIKLSLHILIVVPEYVKDSDYGFGDYALSYIDHQTTLNLCQLIRDARIKTKFGKAFKSFVSGIERMNIDFEKSTLGVIPVNLELNVKEMLKMDPTTRSALQRNRKKIEEIKKSILDLQKQLESERQDFRGITEPSYSNLMDYVKRGNMFDSIDKSLVSVKGILVRNNRDLYGFTDADFLLSEYPYRMIRKGDPVLKLKISERLNKAIGALEWHPFVKVIGRMDDPSHLEVLAIWARTPPTIGSIRIRGYSPLEFRFLESLLEDVGVTLLKMHETVDETIRKINNHQWSDIRGLTLSKYVLQYQRANYGLPESSVYLFDPSGDRDLEKRILSDRAKKGLGFKENEAECDSYEDYAYELLLLKWIFARNDASLFDDPRFAEGAKKLEESLKALKRCLTENNIRSRIPDEF
jgi:hypothetical protein